ncbi:MAG: hypothetical protein F4202_07080 [Cenarchaeum sp. SB0677_bin_16]|nr:hypothetical protein [Cenarchaeum sp. SB0677_bin_16]
MTIWYILVVMMCISGVYYASAEPLAIHMDKSVYNHGDHMEITIIIEHLAGDTALMYIRDSYNVTSSPIPLSISDHNTVWSAPFPFEREVFGEGGYYVDVIYGELFTTTTFEIVDIGNVVVPVWVKHVAYLWASGEASTPHYIDALENLQNLGILQISSTDDATPFIPHWLTDITAWWLTGLVTDDEYVTMIKYLVDNGVIRGL